MSEPVALKQTQHWKVETECGAYDVLIGEPRGETPPDGFPVIYLLDAWSSFGTMLESIRTRCRRPDATGVQPALLVGIAPCAEGLALTERRTRDFTHGPCAEGAPADAPVERASADRSHGHPGGEPGGADRFMAVLRDVIRPRVKAAFLVNSKRQTLFGHSMGGYFVLHHLLEAPDAFQNYVAVSPSIWWHREDLFARASASLTPAHLAAIHIPRLLLYSGQYEEQLAPWQWGTEGGAKALPRRLQRRMTRNAVAFAEHLEEISGGLLLAEHHYFPGEDHASVVPLAINHALRVVLSSTYSN